ncbi:MAG: hypothetical protein WAP37_06890, partial [Solirubrobacterales bacterium]
VNDDGISDRWEKKHRLSLRVNQSRRDQDKDGVANLCERQAGTHPRRKDSDRDGKRDGAEDADRDGVKNKSESRSHSNCGRKDGDEDGVHDGDENAGTILSFDEGVLTIDAFVGDDIVGLVTESTRVKCSCGDDAPGPAEHDELSSSQYGGEEPAPDKPEPDSDYEEDDSDGGDYCSVDDLTVGRVVHEAYLIDGEFVKIKLAE